MRSLIFLGHFPGQSPLQKNPGFIQNRNPPYHIKMKRNKNSHDLVDASNSKSPLIHHAPDGTAKAFGDK